MLSGRWNEPPPSPAVPFALAVPLQPKLLPPVLPFCNVQPSALADALLSNVCASTKIAGASATTSQPSVTTATATARMLFR